MLLTAFTIPPLLARIRAEEALLRTQFSQNGRLALAEIRIENFWRVDCQDRGDKQNFLQSFFGFSVQVVRAITLFFRGHEKDLL